MWIHNVQGVVFYTTVSRVADSFAKVAEIAFILSVRESLQGLAVTAAGEAVGGTASSALAATVSGEVATVEAVTELAIISAQTSKF